MGSPGSAPADSREDRLTRQFYEWEKWGRGWTLWTKPVDLEPPFFPFFGHYDPAHLGTRDDGRRPTLLSSLTDRFLGLNKVSAAVPTCNPEVRPEREPYLFTDELPLVELQLVLPPDTKVTKAASEQSMLSLGHLSRPASFEIVGTNETIVIQVACGKQDQHHVRAQLQAFFPEAVVVERVGYLEKLWRDQPTAVVDYGLSKEFMRPLRCFEKFEPDPLAGLVGAMTELRKDDVGVFQALFTPVQNAWPESILRAVADNEGGSFFVDDRSMLALASQKVSSPLFAVSIRVAACSQKRRRAWRIVRDIGKSLRQYADGGSNELLPLNNDGYEDCDHERDLLARRSRRCGMLLNSDELISFVHLPSPSVRASKLKREERKTKVAPALAVGNRLILGENCHGAKTVPVSLSAEQRAKHTYVIGASGTGKSTLLLNMIVQDIQNGEGFAVLDPHGDLIDAILGHIPEERVPDVVLLDPSDEEYPVGFNILSAHSPLERNLLASDLVSVFRRLATSWGDQMNAVFGNAILAFLESERGGTLSDLRRFLVEPDYRQRFLETVQDGEVVYYWRKEFPLLAGKPQGPILTRLDIFLRPKQIRYMVSQKENRLDFGGIMNGRKILLAKLSQGLIGEENSYLLGTLLVSKLSQTAMSRQELPASERKPFYLYVDEFHNFVTPSMAAILSGARKYNLGLILAHQELQQLAGRDTDVASAVISNPFTRICFRLGDFDAKKLEDGFSYFAAKDLQNLSVGEAICRLERAEYDFNLKTIPLPLVAPELAQLRREAILNSSRQRNATRREEVEALLRRELPSKATEVDAPRVTAKRSPSSKEVPIPTPGVESTSEISAPGRGGQHHKYLQQLIRRWAETRGYLVTIEKPILGGLGSVDVALEKESLRIACEISVTTTSGHELGNIQKCLAAGFGHVLSVSAEKKVLEGCRTATIPVLTEGQRKQVQFLTPEQVFTFLEGLEVKATTASRPGAAVGSKDLLTAKELEELLRIDVKTIYSYVQRGLLPYVRIQSNLRFVRSEILAWMAEKQFRPGSRVSRKKER